MVVNYLIVDLPGPRWPKLPGRWPEREAFDHFRKEKKKKNLIFFPPLPPSESLFWLYFIVLDIFERRGSDGAFCLFAGF